MIRADEVASVARICAADFGAPMATAVQERVQGSVVVPYDDDRSAAQIPAHEIPGRRDLGLVRQEPPRAVENPLHLQAANLVIHEDVATDQASLRINPLVRLRCRGGSVHGATCEISLILHISPGGDWWQDGAAPFASCELAIVEWARFAVSTDPKLNPAFRH